MPPDGRELGVGRGDDHKTPPARLGVGTDVFGMEPEGGRLRQQGGGRRSGVGLGAAGIERQHGDEGAVVAEGEGHLGVLECLQVQLVQDARGVEQTHSFREVIVADNGQGVGGDGGKQLRCAPLFPDSARIAVRLAAGKEQRKDQQAGQNAFFIHIMQIY